MINAYTELNDPEIQQANFKRQSDTDDSHHPDENFVKALEYGMPPAVGWGLGIDRLVMIATNQKSIREVLLYPLLRPEAQGTLKGKDDDENR